MLKPKLTEVIMAVDTDMEVMVVDTDMVDTVMAVDTVMVVIVDITTDKFY